MTLSGTLPAVGEYSGAVVVTGSATTLRIPFMFIVPGGASYGYNVITFLSCCDSNNNYYYEGTGGSDVNPTGYPVLQITDFTGAGIANAPILISAANGLTLKSASGGPACSPASQHKLHHLPNRFLRLPLFRRRTARQHRNVACQHQLEFDCGANYPSLRLRGKRTLAE